MLQPRPSYSLSLFFNSVTLGLFCSGCMLFVFLPDQAAAEVRTVTAQGEHRLGDRDTKEDGIRLAAEQAKRHALEQVASYLESITVVRDLDITQDEIRSYAAGVVVVLNQRVALRLEGETVVVQVALTARVDTDEVVQALAAVKQHEEARGELLALQQELDQLHLDLDAANQALAAAATSEQAREFSNRREALLSQAQSNAMVAQAWTNWLALGLLTYPHAWSSGLPQIQALISAAGQLNPNNPHLHAVQQAVATQPPAPPKPSAAPVPHTVPFLPRMPTYQVVPRPSATSEASTDQPSTLHTWPRTRQSEDPHQTSLEKTAPPAKNFNRSRNSLQQPGSPVASPQGSSSQDPQSRQSPQRSGHMSAGAPTGGDK